MDSSEYSAFGYFLKVIKQYVDFSGRARRKEYWFYTLFYVIFCYILAFVDSAILQVYTQDSIGILSSLFSLVLFLPTLAVSVRRLHDTGRSGWWLLLIFTPLVFFVFFMFFPLILAGLIFLVFFVLLVFFCQDSREDNKYGPNPKLSNR